jgi:hypothetical protein
MDGMQPFQGRTIDVNATGLSLTADHKLGVGQTGEMSFELFVEGRAQLLTTRVKVTYCIFSGDHFKIGYQFAVPDMAFMATLNKFLR